MKQLDERIDPTDANVCVDVANLLEEMITAVSAILWNSWPVPADAAPYARWKTLIDVRDRAEKYLKLDGADYSPQATPNPEPAGEGGER